MNIHKRPDTVTFSHICLCLWNWFGKHTEFLNDSFRTDINKLSSHFASLKLQWCLTTVKFHLWMKKLEQNHSIPIVALLICVNECFRLCSPASGYVTGLTSWPLTSTAHKKKPNALFQMKQLWPNYMQRKIQYLKLKSFFHALYP